MKYLIIASTLLSCSLSYADSAPDLAANMKAINKIVKQITADLADPTKKNDSAVRQADAAAAASLVDLFAKSEDQMLDNIAKLPPAMQAACQAEYKIMLEKESADAKDLSKDLLSGDIASAQAILLDMGNGKKAGHDKCKKPQ